MFGSAFDIILLITAVAILYKLYSILGQNPQDINFDNNMKNNSDKVIDIEAEEIIVPQEDIVISDINKQNPKVYNVIKEINSYNPKFNEKSFLNGASKAFEAIINAYTKHDHETLKELLTEEVYQEFSNEINALHNKNQFLEKTIVAIISCELIDATIEGKNAKLKVRYISQQINLLKDSEGNVIEGNPSRIEKMEDIWTFTKKVNSSSPNWKLTATNN